MESKHDHYMERRAGIDRRKWQCKYDFPYVDGHGILVTYNRRNSDERRSIAMTITELSTKATTKASNKFLKRNIRGWLK